ncbi:hypothetical protein ADK67_31155 [Saccharothrix sp. NRRL B-16348]|uniref:aminotransferase-like domain-containing protein n=1 Tax=Saccharothrix sp. NRRL B-16348 TaxID=1415542 RepID=UPI0006ADAEF6|nr:PLP-dependent aminotransferase family protein [Saccharothrix sp. NRRL B-16348]KOX20029.1 hypothetical protein ADK67_31155 [Saccharothrix sp. NRRL B-16348]
MLATSDINPAITDPVLASMNLLNEVTLRYPRALSFGAGRPFDGLHDVEASLALVRSYVDREAAATNRRAADLMNQLGQYGRTKGLIHELVAEMLRNDEGIEVDPDSIVITSGAQEAMALCVTVLCGRVEDVALAGEPGYVGFAGIAKLLGTHLEGLVLDGRSMTPRLIRSRLTSLSDRGRRPRLLYCNPDFSNPTGRRMSLSTRQELLRIAEDHDLLIVEDSTYRYFSFDQTELPSLKSLDENRRVIYSGTFSKTLFPGLRIGYLVADQAMQSADGPYPLADELSKAKSMFTNNTSPICQAIVGGYLLEHGCSLRAAVQPKVEFYRRNRDVLLASFDHCFPRGETWTDGVDWSTPDGGFFATLRVPFEVDHDALNESAAEHGVIWIPMRDFYLGPGGESEIRLAFSSLDPEQIREGVRRLALFVRSRVLGDHPGMAGTRSGAVSRT